MRHRLLAAVPISALVLLAGCGTADTGQAGSSSAASSTPGPAATAPSSSAAAPGATSPGDDVTVDGSTDAAPFPANTDPDTGAAVPGEGPTVVTDVRIGSQDGFGRVVFDIAGTATPGWDVAYTDTVTQEGSGQAIDLPGTAYLRVTLTGITNPYEAPDVAEAAVGSTLTEAGPVVGVYYDSVFEGQALAYIGLDAEQPFRVYALSDPTRIVVDIAD